MTERAIYSARKMPTDSLKSLSEAASVEFKRIEQLVNSRVGSVPAVHTLGKFIGLDLDTTADQPVTIKITPPWVYFAAFFTNASTTPTTVSGEALYTGAGRTGTQVVSWSGLVAGLSSADRGLWATRATGSAANAVQSVTTAYFSITAKHGSACTVDMYLFGYALSDF